MARCNTVYNNGRHCYEGSGNGCIWLLGAGIELLASDQKLKSLYDAELFDPDLIRGLGLIPTEYLFFYYSRRRALENQLKQGSTRGAEIEQLSRTLIPSLARLLLQGDGAGAIATYAEYLNTRSGAYMKLEGEGGSALHVAETVHEDPFRAASGYHRIALAVIP